MTVSMITGLISLLNLFCTGILAGEEITIRYGVRGPLASLDDRPHIQLRQALIRTLRILVPAIFAAALLSAVAVTLLEGLGPGFGWRCAQVLALLVFIGLTLSGTVPINEAALDWNPAAPPANWRTLITRWERLDSVRCWLAVTAFALSVAGMALG